MPKARPCLPVWYGSSDGSADSFSTFLVKNACTGSIRYCFTNNECGRWSRCAILHGREQNLAPQRRYNQEWNHSQEHADQRKRDQRIIAVGPVVDQARSEE